MKSSGCTLLVESFPKRPRTRSEASQFGGSHKYKQNKQNKHFPFIDRYRWWGMIYSDVNQWWGSTSYSLEHPW
jgi:hypothetical protein